MLSLAARRSLLRHRSSAFTRSMPSSQQLLFSIASNGEDMARHSSKQSSTLLSTPGFLNATRLNSPMAASNRVSGIAMPPFQVRFYARRSNRDPWGSGQRSDWLDTVKTGAMLALGAGAVVAFASVGFGFIVFTAAGYGAYKLYDKFVAPFRSPRDPFGAVQADIDKIFRNNRSASTRGAARSDSDVDALVEGLPFVLRGVIKAFSGIIGGALQSSMARAGELRRLTNEHLQANSRIGGDVRISTPQNWSEYTVNGVGRVEAVFPVVHDGYTTAQVDVKASIGSNGQLSLVDLKYRNLRTGEVIDLLRDAPTSRARRTVVDAEYVDRE